MMQNFERPCWGGQCTQKGQDSPGFCKCRADAAEIERLRAAANLGLSWMADLEHMGSIVDQERLSVDLAKVTEALGWVRGHQQQPTKETE